ncbi:MAG: glycoside hydrolase family 43 protein [Acidobacteriaceae bacterium]
MTRVWSALWRLVFIMTLWPGWCAAQSGQSLFYNPVLLSGPDPWVIQHDGFYYFMSTTGVNLTIWKTRDVTDLAHAEKKVVWVPQPGHAWSKEVWAPELHFLDQRWYIYFAADDGQNADHRVWAAENASRDPLEGAWTLKGKVADATDKWAIDPTILTLGGVNYLIWSGWQGDTDGQQSLYIARLKNPWTIEGPRVRLSYPQYPWEKVGDFDTPGVIRAIPHVDVNEGPEILEHRGRIFLTYSASGCWTDSYELGMLALAPGGDPMNPQAWTKSPAPVFWQNPAGAAYAPGHNGFFLSPDGQQNWIVYHANPAPHEGCGALRSVRMQPFRWNSDGTPDFGRPVPLGQLLPKPSGTE